MTDEEKRAADAAAAEAKAAEEAAAKEAEEAAKQAAIEAAEAEATAKDAEIAKLKEERDNYRNVALKRLGKLPGDAEFTEAIDEKTGLTVAEQVKQALIEREIAAKETERDTEARRLAKENAELKLALQTRPDGALGSGSGSSSSVEVKDPVFTQDQLADLRKRAERLGADPEKFIEQARKNFLNRG